MSTRLVEFEKEAKAQEIVFYVTVLSFFIY